jgi:hypothetical protein
MKVNIRVILAILVFLGLTLTLLPLNGISIHEEARIEISSGTEDCIYTVAGMGGSPFYISLDDVYLMIINPNLTVLLPPTSLTAFNSSGDLYYHHVRFNDATNPDQLNVGDSFQFNRSVYWGSKFRLFDSGGTTLYSEVTIDDPDASFLVIIPPMDWPSPSLSTNTVLLGFSIVAAAILIGTAILIRIFKVDEEKRRIIWQLVTAVMGILIVAFIAAILYTMVLYA